MSVRDKNIKSLIFAGIVICFFLQLTKLWKSKTIVYLNVYQTHSKHMLTKFDGCPNPGGVQGQVE